MYEKKLRVKLQDKLELKLKTLKCYIQVKYEVCSKIRGLFELRGSSWFQENPLGVVRFVQIR